MILSMGLLDVLKKKKHIRDENSGTKEPEPMYTYVVQDIFTIKGQGSVVVGVVEGGTIRTGDSVYIIKRGKQLLQASVTAIENPSQGRMQEAPPKSNVALMFREISSSQLERGDVISNGQPAFSYEDGRVNPRLEGLLAERGHTIIKNLEDYIQEEMALYGQQKAAGGSERENVKGGAEYPSR